MRAFPQRGGGILAAAVRDCRDFLSEQELEQNTKSYTIEEAKGYYPYVSMSV